MRGTKPKLLWRSLQVCAAALCLCGPVKADLVACPQGFCDLQGFQVDVILGTVQLYSAGGTLLSSTTGVTVDFPLWPDLEAQMVSDPLPWGDGVPAEIRDHLPGLIGNTDLGAFVNPQGVVTIDQAEQTLIAQLESSLPPATVTGDTEYNLGYLFGYGYISSLVVGQDNYAGFVAVNYYGRDIQETLAPVPEPASWTLIAAAIGGVLLRRKRRG